MDLTGITINNHYKLIKKVAEGRISSLYLTNRFDIKNEPIAIKIFKDSLTTKRNEDLIRFRHELNILSTIDHPHLVRVYDTGEIYKLQYVVLEHVRGAALSEILGNTGFSLGMIVDIIIQACRALDCLHQNGIIHRDLRPGNVFMQESPEPGSVHIKLTNSATMCIKNFSELLKTEELGDLLAYVSPEQSGLIKRQVDERSDMYSLGIILYQLLTGRTPFTGDDSILFLQQHAAQPPESPSGSNPLVPPLLDSIVLKLLEREPEKRYQSAKGLLSDLERYKSGDRQFIAGLNDASIRLGYRTKLTGRDRELNKLRRLFDWACEGWGGLCLISGEVGVGKTRLIEDFHDYIRKNGAVFIHAKCFSGENKEPYGPLKDALNEYLKIFSTYSDKRKNEIIDKISVDVGALGGVIIKLNPQMKEILGRCPAMVALKPDMENERFLAIASRFFINLSCIENGLVLSIDDLQWCDEGSLELLSRIVNGASNFPLLAIGTYRNVEITEGHHLLSFIKNAENRGSLLAEIAIDYLDCSTMNIFISGLLHEDETKVGEISGFIHKKSKGNPFFAIEILKQLVDEKSVYYDDNKWHIDHTALSRAAIPDSVIDILIRRISFLSRKEATVLSFAAVIGRSFASELLFHLLSDFNTKELVGIIDKLIQLQLLDKEVNSNGRLSFVHDRIREAFYCNIAPDARKKMHARVAESLEALHADSRNDVLFILAHHYIESGNRSKSFEYAYPASFNAADDFANEDALRYFGIAGELLDEKMSGGDSSARPLWMKSKEGMARVYLRIGRYDDAITIFNALLPFCCNDMGKALILQNISSAYYKKGDWGKCEEYGKIGIEMLGGKLPVARGWVVASLIEELLVHWLHVLLPGLFIAKRIHPGRRKKILQGIFYESLIPSYILSERLKYIRSILKILNLVESYSGGGKAYAKALSGYATLLMSRTRFKEALKYHRKALNLSIEIHDPTSIGRSFQLIGYCHEWSGDYGKAIEHYNKALDIFTGIGDSNGIGITLNGLSNSYYFIADYEKLKATNKKFFEIASKANDHYQMCNALIFRTLYYLGIGKYDSAETTALQAHALSAENKLWMPNCILKTLLGTICKYANDIGKSLIYLEDAKKLYEKHKFLKYYTIHFYPILAEAYLNEILCNTSMTVKQKKPCLKRVKKSCNTALKKTAGWAPHYNYSLNVLAQYYAAIKKNSRAKKFYLRAIGNFSKLGMKFEYARNLYEYGQFLSQSGEANLSQKAFESAYPIFEEVGSTSYSEKLRTILGIIKETGEPNTIQKSIQNKRLSSIDRLSERFNQIMDFDKLLHAVISKAAEITSAEKGYLFIANDKNELALKSCINIPESEECRYSREIVERVFKNSHDVITTLPSDVDETAETREVPASAEKAVLSVAVKMNNTVIGVCYLENSLSNGRFTGEDAEFLAAFLSKVSLSINYARAYHKSTASKNDEQWTVTPAMENKINSVISYLKDNFRFNIAREGLASMLDINSDNLGRYFKAYTGEKIGDYINRLRIEEAARKLKETNENVIHIAYSVGFENISTFNKVFSRFMKTTPTSYRKHVYDSITT